METGINGCDNGRDAKGKFLPGNPGKPRGSSKNKLRDEIKTFLNDNWPSFQGWFDQLKPREKIECLLSLLPYSLPRLQSITNVDGEDIKHEEGIDFSNWSEADLRTLISLTDKYNGEN